MKVTLLVDLVQEVYEDVDSDIFETVSQVMKDADDVKIVSVEMTPEEQISAFDSIVSRWEI